MIMRLIDQSDLTNAEMADVDGCTYDRESILPCVRTEQLKISTIKSHFKALGLYNKRNKKNMSERRDKTYLRIKLKPVTF